MVAQGTPSRYGGVDQMTESSPEANAIARLIVETPDALAAQGTIEWYPNTWRKWLHDSDKAISAVEAVVAESESAGNHLAIDRDGVRRVASKGDVLSTFIGSQVWGHGTNGNGAWRASVALGLHKPKRGRKTDWDTSVNYLSEALRLCQTEGGVRAYEYMVNEGKLPWLGTAFLTKYLFFVPGTCDPKPLVLDDLVRRVIDEHAGNRLSRRFGWTDYFRDYLRLVDDVVRVVSEEYGRTCSPEDVEVALFRLGKSM